MLSVKNSHIKVLGAFYSRYISKLFFSIFLILIIYGWAWSFK